MVLSVKEYELLISQRKGSLLPALSAYRALKDEVNDEISFEEVENWRDTQIGRKLPWE